MATDVATASSAVSFSSHRSSLSAIIIAFAASASAETIPFPNEVSD